MGYTRQIGRGMGQVGCSSALSPGNCASVGGSYDPDAETCNCAASTATPAVPLVPAAPMSCAAGSGSACSWYDNIWATQGCLDWYAACDPTNAFYLTNSKGLIAGGSAVLGNTLSSSLNNFLGLPQTSIPTWAWVAGFGLAAFLLLPPFLKAVR